MGYERLLFGLIVSSIFVDGFDEMITRRLAAGGEVDE
jgi:hypothetical protein